MSTIEMEDCEKELTVCSPAKININLKVLRLRPDGYHDIESVVQPVSIFDTVQVKVGNQNRISLETNFHGIPTAEGNTAFTAARLFQEKTGLGKGIHVYIDKKIPVGAGLGGGSGNAAAVLVMLNTLFPVFSPSELREVGKEIGRDVPLFIDSVACKMSGTGEKIEQIPDFPLLSYVVSYPGFPCETRAVYRKWDQLMAAGVTKEVFWPVQSKLEIINGLEVAAFSLYPALRDFNSSITSKYNVPFLMTGSGSALFSVFEDHEDAGKLFQQMQKDNFNCILTRGINGWKTDQDGRQNFYPVYRH